MTAPGDSGGPSLLNGLIAGVTSLRLRPPQSDIDAVGNSSFGEIGADTRVSAFAGWIDSVVDIIAPNAPTMLNLITADDTGFSNTDNRTRFTTLHFDGIAEAGATVELLEGGAVIGTGVAVAGAWNIQVNNMTDGVHNLRARARDAAGNVSALSGILQVTVDTQRPRANLSDPANDSRTTPLANATVRFVNQTSGQVEEGILNFGVVDLRLTVNNSPNRLADSGSISLTSPGVYQLSNLNVPNAQGNFATDSPGDYLLTLVDAGLQIEDLAGNTLVSVVNDTWNQILTYTGTNVDATVRVGTTVVRAEATGTVRLSANATSITKQELAPLPPTSTLVITTDSSINFNLPITFNAFTGRTEFNVNVGNATTRNWSVTTGGGTTVTFFPAPKLNELTIGPSALVEFAPGGGTAVINSLGFLSAAAAPVFMSGGSVLHQSNGTDVPVSVSIGNTTITGNATGAVYLVYDTSDPVAALRKFGPGTFKLTNVSNKTVPFDFRNEEGKTEFHANTGDPAAAGSVNWSVTLYEIAGLADSSVEFHTTQNLTALHVTAGTAATMLQNGNRVLAVNALNVGIGGTLDLKDNDLIVHAAPGTRDEVFASLYAMLVSAFNGGTWDGTGLTSSVARDNVNFDTALGIGKNADLGYSSFAGQAVNSDSILIKYTYYGDADLDGDVDGDDQTLLSNNYGSTYAFWADGDVDYNNNVNADDLTVFANNFGKSGL